MAKQRILLIIIAGFFLFVCVAVNYAEEMTITTYYPSPNGTYDALNVKRLSVGDTNGDGSINASDVSPSSGYLLVADKLGIGTTAPQVKLHIKGDSGLYMVDNNSQPVFQVDASSGDNVNYIDFFTPSNSGRSDHFKWYVNENASWIPQKALSLWQYPSDNLGGCCHQHAIFGIDALGNNFQYFSGNVGIGTTSPQGRLDIAGGGISNVRGIYALTDGTTNIDLLYHQNNSLYIKSGASSGKVFIGASGEVPLCVFGNVGIGTESPAGKLDINAVDAVWILGYSTLSHISNGSTFLKASSGNYIGFQIPNGTNVATINSSGTYSVSSDQRLKMNIQPLDQDNGLAAVKRLNPVTFNWKSVDVTKSSQMGFIAQDVQKVFPQLVTDMGEVTIKLANGTTQTVPDAKGISYEGLIAPMVKAIQEQQKQIDDLRSEIKKLTK